MFQLETNFEPKGSQPEAIEKLTKGIEQGNRSQVLLGITGSGKTFTMANVIANINRPSLILAHNKTLAAQLYQEFKAFFPHNAVEYFVSYYDYYQPEAYIPRSDTYIEKDMSINDRIDRLRLSATRSLIERDDVIIVASVSCIYGLGIPEYYAQMNLFFQVGEEKKRDELLLHLVAIHYKRNEYDFTRGHFRVRGDVIDIFPAYEEKTVVRLEFFDETLEKISLIDPLTSKVQQNLDEVTIFPGSHFVTPESVRVRALETIKEELGDRKKYYSEHDKPLEKERIIQRTMYDLEVMKEIGFCKGIENYSRHFSQRNPGDSPPCLLDYFPKDFLMFIDESHQTVPQLRAMYNGDKARKQNLVDFGFRLPSAYDNRPLKFDEVYERINRVVYVSATPGIWEVNEAGSEIIEQIIRPTGLLDPKIEIRPTETQIDDCLDEIKRHIQKKERVLVTTLTKRLAEDITKYLNDLDVKAGYLHSDIDTLDRVVLIQDLRKGVFDVLVGINLLREGLDIPEVSLVAILDADKAGFLRSETSLLQTCGRASRNSEGRVIMYADVMTAAITNTIKITESRRKNQIAYNKAHDITPQTTTRENIFHFPGLEELEKVDKKIKHNKAHDQHITLVEVQKKIKEYEKGMKKAAKELEFEEAARLRDLMQDYQEIELSLS